MFIVSTINILVKNWIQLACLLKKTIGERGKFKKKLECYKSKVKKLKKSDKMSLNYINNTTLNHPDCMAGFKKMMMKFFHFLDWT